MEVNADRTAFARYPMHILKAAVGRYLIERKLLLHTSIAFTSGLQDRYDAPAQARFKGGRLQLDIMGKYTFRKDAFFKVTLKNLTADENTRAPWTVDRDWGIVGSDERTYYFELGVRL
jgi:hypothetical protein